MKILVSGSSGFIGSHIVNELKKREGITPILDINHVDLRNKNEVLNFPKADVVIHAAGKTSQTANDDLTYLIDNNVVGTFNLLQYCFKKKIEKLIYISSYVYGKPEYCPIDENHPINPHNPYAQSKYLAEQLCQFYSKNYDTKLIILRPFNIFGKSQRLGFLMPNLLSAIQTDKKVTITNKTSKRDFLHINDFVNLILRMLNYDTKFEIFNVGSGKAYSFEEVIKKIEKITQKKFNIEFNENKDTFMEETRANISKIKNHINWQPKIELEEGLRHSLES